MMKQKIGLVAGRGVYPSLVLDGAKAQGVALAVAAFEGETDSRVASRGQPNQWLKVGQLGGLISFFRKAGVKEVIFAGQIAPKRLFDLRPDLKALWILARLKERNAETLFGAVAKELARAGIKVLPATTFVEDHLASRGHLAGPKPPRNLAAEIAFGWPLAKSIARLHIGQSLVVRKGTVMAVEGFDGTDATLKRGGTLAGQDAVAIKVTSPAQDMRFDVPVIGPQTILAAAEGKVGTLVIEAHKTLILEAEEVRKLAVRHKVTVWGQVGKGTK
ncbi:MAG: UDP-2,3-diacylglucosamine diphosphatase LpxI [Verrucomicrobia bacterium]|nr:UDP-2,3-diacylglucosamine diphosphatase LpxI [Verrucomicrobiota bacterium]